MKNDFFLKFSFQDRNIEMKRFCFILFYQRNTISLIVHGLEDFCQNKLSLSLIVNFLKPLKDDSKNVITCLYFNIHVLGYIPKVFLTGNIY